MFQSAQNKILNVAVCEYEGKYVNEMRRDNRESGFYSLYCVHDNKGLILNDKCCGCNAFFVLCGFFIFF